MNLHCFNQMVNVLFKNQLIQMFILIMHQFQLIQTYMDIKHRFVNH
jgi:hypothetical protein